VGNRNFAGHLALQTAPSPLQPPLILYQCWLGIQHGCRLVLQCIILMQISWLKHSNISCSHCGRAAVQHLGTRQQHVAQPTKTRQQRQRDDVRPDRCSIQLHQGPLADAMLANSMLSICVSQLVSIDPGHTTQAQAARGSIYWNLCPCTHLDDGVHQQLRKIVRSPPQAAQPRRYRL